MTTTDTDYARLEAVLSLREIAGYYLKSAEEAGNPTVWEARLRLAAKLEEEAAALKRILPDISEAERAASGEYTTPTGELVVTAPIGLGRLYLMPILADIYEGFQVPDVWTFARAQADVAITIRPRLVVSTVEAACDAALAGIGLTRAFSYHVGPSIEEGALATALDEFRPSPLPISFVYPAGRFLPVKLRAFLDFASPLLKARLSR